MSKTTAWSLGIGLVVILGILWYVLANSSNTQPQPYNPAPATTTTTQVASSAPPTTDYKAALNTFIAACTEVKLSSTTKVLQFSQEGATTTDGGAPAYKCKDGHTYIY